MREFVINTKTGCVHIRGQCPDASQREKHLGTDKERVAWIDLGQHGSLAEAANYARRQNHQNVWIGKTCQKHEDRR